MVRAWRCGVCRGAVVRGTASLRLSPWCPPLLRYLVVLCLPWPVAVPPSPRASLVGLLAIFLLPSALWRSLPFPVLHVGLPPTWRAFFPASRASLCVFWVFFLACFLIFWVLFLLSFLML